MKACRSLLYFEDEMEALATLLPIWAIHAAIAGVLTFPIVFLGRRRVDWLAWEPVVFVLPFAIWAALMMSDLAADRKSIANLAEPVYFAGAIPLAALIRAIVGRRGSGSALAWALIVMVCLAAVAVFFLVPPLPEVPG